VKSALIIGALDFTYCLIFAANMRAIARGGYALTFATDLVLGIFAFTIVRMIASASTTVEMAAYCLGGAAGACAGIWTTKHFERTR
jgi:hypothetical protein